MMGQLRSAKPRTLKPDVAEGDRIQFTEDEIIQVGERMIACLEALSSAVLPPDPETSGTGGT